MASIDKEYVVMNYRVVERKDGLIAIVIKTIDGDIFDLIFPKALAIMLNVDLRPVLGLQ